MLGESTDCDNEMPAVASLRGRTALVTCRCPRKFSRTAATRKAEGNRIPADLSKKAFLDAFRRVVGSQCNQQLESATCHSLLHGRVRRSTKQPEVKYSMAVHVSDKFTYHWFCFPKPHQKFVVSFPPRVAVLVHSSWLKSGA